MSAVFSSPAVAAQILAVIVSVVVYRRYIHPLSEIPGPFWASITRLWQICYLLKGEEALEVVALHDKHGHFVRIAPNEVSVSHPDGPRLLLLAPLRKGNWYTLFALPDWRFQNPMSTLDPKEKVERSKWLSSGYSLSNILKSEEYIDKNIAHLQDWMDKYAADHKPMHLDKFLSYTVFDNTGEALFSEPFGFISEGRDVGGALRNNEILNPVVAAFGFLTVFQWIFANPVVTWLGVLPMGHLFDTTTRAMKKRQKNPDARFDIAAHWFRMQQKNPDRLSLRQVEAQATLSVGGGADTISCGIQSFVYHMMRRPELWERARHEIDAVNKDGICQGTPVSFSEAQNMPFLQACVKEALRILGPTPSGLPRVAPKGGLSIGDRHFPEGTVLSIHGHVMQLSKEHWGPDAREFNPNRWFADDIGTKEKFWLVFGVGYNSCPGQHLARVQITKMAATIVRDYDILQVDPCSEWKWKAYISIVPHSWPVYVQKRTLRYKQ
ncbi:cytochrome P450 [Pseudomassariella vexata]|uniref:Cytochrome P450 n=1 Tax=Pseudomassariella vexata TaxID=1141098 RepID=A0A1Y2DXP1_9PEZI|nr:cytochrome P450 [Pseudomassariella vexata]ORY63884.1 cytochrome P450 [Pseudomassariella vexata]